ncbi:hypothetical protein CN962_01810 [Bacillus cereus]|uniref:DUF3942 family protein n=1 Tax=Bacillus cereus TaxID=1396 RepID=UPI000BFE8ECF|nr:DUF3942 family protein [Bacillus cereus]PGN51600.1 hypothetical protein CN962_01810 [Bacillus cereus]
MSKLDQFIEKTKAYVVTDLEEKLLRERYKSVVIPCMKKIEDGLKSVEGFDYHINVGDLISKLEIHDKNFAIMINSSENSLVINATDTDNRFVELDRIILKDENLFSTKREQLFTEDILVDYLNETFEGIIG